MTIGSLSSVWLGWTAIATGSAGLLALLFIILFFTIGQPFGTLNDIFIGITALLSGILAWMLYAQHHAQSPRYSLIALVLALAGAVVVAIGSTLVVSGKTGWYLAGLYTGFGNAFIGLWLLGLNLSAQQTHPWPQNLITFGVVVGAVMTLGLLTLPGLLKGIDTWGAAPWYVNYIGQVGGLGWLALYPIWCVLLGRAILAS
ncbi:MAG: hypothetical protein EPO32_14555 [Anaerolineae bacterium]|nr:MAG: hypothetical protein EPO32_14555 [Anaerolineae bacterium]